MSKENKKWMIIAAVLVIAAIGMYITALVVMGIETRAIQERSDARAAIKVEKNAAEAKGEIYYEKTPDCLKDEALNTSSRRRSRAGIMIIAGIVCMVCACGVVSTAKNDFQLPDGENTGTYTRLRRIPGILIGVVSVVLAFVTLFFALMSEVVEGELLSFLILIATIVVGCGFGYLLSTEKGYFVAEETALILTNPLGERRIEFGRISSTNCKVQRYYGRRGQPDRFFLEMHIYPKTGRKTVLIEEIGYEYLKNPDKYKTMMDEHRYSKLSDYINRHLSASRE